MLHFFLPLSESFRKLLWLLQIGVAFSPPSLFSNLTINKMDIFKLLQGQLSPQLLDKMGDMIGGASREQTAAASQPIISALMSGLNKNASSSPSALGSLVSALDRDHDGSVLDDAMGFITGAMTSRNSNMFNGAGILQHVLGAKNTGITNMVGRMTGLDNSKVGKLMLFLAPVVMGALGKARQTNNTSAIGKLLGQAVQSGGQDKAQMGIIGSLLDRDGDGGVLDDIASIGLNMLGKAL